jgi:hypothetical protein
MWWCGSARTGVPAQPTDVTNNSSRLLFFYSLTTRRVCVALASINERPEFKKTKSNFGRIKSTLDDAHCKLCLKQSKVQVVVAVVVVQCETMSAGPLAAAAGLVESVMSFWLEAGATTEELLRSVCRQNSFSLFLYTHQEVLPSSLLASVCSV